MIIGGCIKFREQTSFELANFKNETDIVLNDGIRPKRPKNLGVPVVIGLNSPSNLQI